MGLTRDRMWERMMASDPASNGRFYTGVHSTGIYCLPSCRARKPKPENVRFYVTAEEAEAAGLRPCKKCRPDEFARGVDSDLARLSAVVDIMRADPGRFASVDAVAYEAAMSASTLFAAFRTHYHVSPGALLAISRVRKAAALLRAGASAAQEAGIEAGFDSTSAYYENFGRLMGMPPAQYRRLGASDDFSLELPADYRREIVLALLARDPDSRTERVESDRFLIVLWAGEQPAVVRARFAGRHLHVCREGGDPFEIHRQLVRLLSLEHDPRPFEEHVRSVGLGALVAGREGLRIPQATTPFDGLVWSIVGQQVGLGFAAKLRRQLTELAGTPIDGELSAPPTASRVAELAVEDLARLQFSRRKAEYLIGAARAVVSGELSFERLAAMPPAHAEKTLLTVRGIGPWSANYLMMRALGFPDCVPLGDTGLTSGLARFFQTARPDPESTISLMEIFRPHRSLATYHLWRSLG